MKTISPGSIRIMNLSIINHIFTLVVFKSQNASVKNKEHVTLLCLSYMYIYTCFKIWSPYFKKRVCRDCKSYFLRFWNWVTTLSKIALFKYVMRKAAIEFESHKSTGRCLVGNSKPSYFSHIFDLILSRCLFLSFVFLVGSELLWASP